MKSYWRWALPLISFGIVSRSPLHAQDHTLLFSTGAAGVTKAIANWGLDVTWPSPDNMRRGLVFMGTD